MLNPNIVLIGVALQLIGGYSYLMDTIRGRVQPNRVTWLMWAIAPLVAFAAEITQGVGIQSLSTFIVGFLPLIIFIASFTNKKAEWKLGVLDIVCGVLSALGIILWYMTRVGNVAILFAILADFLAAVPTIVKSYKEPESENYKIFMYGIINALFGSLAVQKWSFEHYAFPAYLLLVNSFLTILIKFKLGTILRLRKA